MDLTTLQKCPSCGAQIELHEADRLLRCPYCDVQNFMVSRGTLRFVLPDKVPQHIERKNIFYAPYLRFKGNIFYCKGELQRHKVVDTTLQGVKASFLPASIGYRPQAMPVSLVTDDIKGVFLRQTIKLNALLEIAAKLTARDSKQIKAPLHHRAYIGETLSCIYLPLYVDGEVLYDGVTNKALARGGSVEKLRKSGARYNKNWSPHFLATLCPECGDSLTGSPDSLILSCWNCHSSWRERQGGFTKISWSIVPSGMKTGPSLPFWKLHVHSSGISMKSFADFLRLTNRPLVIQRKHELRDLVFFIPAFKLKPSNFLQLAGNVTLRQEKIPVGEKRMAKRMFPVTLQESEALQALKSVVARVAVSKRNLFPGLPKMNFHPTAAELIYLPFEDKGHDYVQEQTGSALVKSILHFGRKL